MLRPINTSQPSRLFRRRGWSRAEGARASPAATSAGLDQCTPLDPGVEGPFGDPTCDDGIDNNCNGLTDALDPNCTPTCDPTPEVCNGLDDDCDGLTDADDPSMASCVDSDPCTADTCVGGVCQYVATPGAACDDGDGSTTDDVCSSAGTTTSVVGTLTCTESQAPTWDGTDGWINVDKAWTHSYAAISGTIVSATLSIQIGDDDSGPLAIVSGATPLGSITGGDNGGPGAFTCTSPGFTENVLTILPSLYADLADGTFQVSTSGCSPTCAGAPAGPGTYGIGRAILTIEVVSTCGGAPRDCDDANPCTTDSWGKDLDLAHAARV